MKGDNRDIGGYALMDKMRRARRTFRFTATEQALFYELVAVCNSEDWADVFSCSNSELCYAIDVTERTLMTARNTLVNAGLIYYEKGKSTRSRGKYSFVKDFEAVAETVAETVAKNDTHITYNKTKQKHKLKVKDNTDVLSKKFDFKKSLLSYGFEEKLVDDWLLVRKNKKATNSETAYSQFILEVEKAIASYPLKINDLLRHIVAKSWSGYKANWDVSEIWQNANNQNFNNQKTTTTRSEERRVGKECRSRWSPYH